MLLLILILKVFFFWQVPLLLLAQCLPSVVFVGHSQQTPSLPPDVHVFTVPLEISGPGTVLVACLRESQCLEELTRDQVLFWLSHSGVCVLRCSTNKVLTFESTLQLSYYLELSFSSSVCTTLPAPGFERDVQWISTVFPPLLCPEPRWRLTVPLNPMVKTEDRCFTSWENQISPLTLARSPHSTPSVNLLRVVLSMSSKPLFTKQKDKGC